MPLKLNISDKGKAWRLEIDAEVLAGKSVGDKLKGEDIKPELAGYELEITGGCDSSGFPLSKNVEGLGLKRILTGRGFGMRESKPDGLRKRKTIRGKVISEKTALLNLNVLKVGSKKLEEIFPDQNKKEEVKAESPKETKVEAIPAK